MSELVAASEGSADPDVLISSPFQESSRRVLRGREAALARNMTASLAIPTASTIRSFEVSALMTWRAEMTGKGHKVPVAAVIAFVLARAAEVRVPAITRRIEIVDDKLGLVEDGVVNLGVAVDVVRNGGRSIMVPVLKDAAAMSFTGLARHLEELAEACRAGTIAVSDLKGANLVLTSTGKFGSTTGVPLLPAGPGAIIAAGTIGVPAGLERLAKTQPIDPVLTLSSTYDHRAVQGADSGEFLATVQELLQSREILAELGDDLLASSWNVAAVPAPQPAAAGSARVEGVRVAELDIHTAAARARIAPLRARAPGEWRPAGVEVEFAHLPDARQIEWFSSRLGEQRFPPRERRLEALRLVSEIDVFENFLQTQFLGKKTLSVEGLDSTVVALAEIAGAVAQAGGSEVVVGMAHRGRLAIMRHVLQWPAERIFAEFMPDARATPDAPSGDVRQHIGGLGHFTDVSDTSAAVTLEQNPSHLEFVSPVALGAVRSKQDELVNDGVDPLAARRRVVPVLLHGDAAFTGQGVVYETLNLQSLAAYEVGGAIHVIQDNRLGFTATPDQLRSTPWPSDVVKGFGVPVLHTDADDIDANLAAASLAFAYRQEFGSDVAIHVIGYRRRGHDESDEPRYTQPMYYADVDAHAPVFEIYSEQLRAEGLVDDAHVEAVRTATRDSLAAALTVARATVPRTDEPSGPGHARAHPEHRADAPWCFDTLDRAERDRSDFALHPKLLRQFVRRRGLRDSETRLDWGQGELLALKYLNEAGVPIRLTGEDVERGTFSHRHVLVHDAVTGRKDTRLTFSDAPFLVANSPLTETATVGFEYGYGRTNTSTLQLWEAQFGDFVNVAQVMFDQFVLSGKDKWGRDGRLVALLPHGWEGAGPEHSSARMERFLQLAARNNVRVLIPTSAAQYFRALVSAGMDLIPIPHIIFTPKSLLRAEAARSDVSEFGRLRLQPLLSSGCSPADAQRLVLCAGKVGLEAEKYLDGRTRLLRLEQLYPFPEAELRAEIAAAPDLDEVVWMQEEPENMGAWRYVSHQLLRSRLTGVRLGYLGRPESPSPAEGYPSDHLAMQTRILESVGIVGAADWWLTGEH